MQLALSIFSSPAGNDGEAMSQDTGSSADRAFAAAWARVHGNNASDPAAPSRLATAWQAQHDSPDAAQQLHSKPATRPPASHTEIVQPQAKAAEQRLKSAQLPVDAQASMAVAQSPSHADTGTPQHLSDMAEGNATGEPAAPSENQMYDADHHIDQLKPLAHASPFSAAPQHPNISPAAHLSPGQQGHGQPAVTSPALGDKAGSPAAATRVVRRHAAARPALADRNFALGTRLAGPPAKAATSMQPASADRDSPELETRAMHLAMQVSMLTCRLGACATG